MRKATQQGFTLIELIIVIVILGILAVTAAPKFINFQSDAKESTLAGFRGALQGANSGVYAKAVLAGEQGIADNTAWAANTGNTTGVDIGTGTPILTNYGYLPADGAALAAAMDIDLGDWTITAATGQLTISPAGAPAATCNFVYAIATATAPPTYTLYAGSDFAC